MRLFLDKLFEGRIAILSFIENSLKPVTIKEVVEHTGMSKNTVLKFVKEFAEENTSSGNFKINYTNESIQTVQAENLNVVKTISYYSKKSVLYQMTRYIFLHNSLEVSKFCEKTFISPATLSRYRKILVKNLSQCGLGLSKNNQIIGSELQIRNFFILFFSNISEEWQFDSIYYEEVYRYLLKNLPNWETYTSQEQKKIILILFVTKVCSRKNKKMDIPELKKLTQAFQQTNNIKVIHHYFSLNRKKNHEEIWDETSAAVFFLYKERLLKEVIDVKAYSEFCSTKQLAFTRESEELTKRIITHFFWNCENSNLYWKIRQEVDLFHLQLAVCFLDPRLFYYIYDKEKFAHLDLFEKQLRNEVCILVKELLAESEFETVYKKRPSHIEQDTLEDYLYLMIYSLIIHFTETESVSIKIVVKNSKIFVKEILKNKIASFFGDRIEFVQVLEAADLIVTDMEIPVVKIGIPVIYVSTFSDVADVTLLFKKVNDLIIDKIAQRKVAKYPLPIKNTSRISS